MSDTHPLADGQTQISPWMPEQDRVRLAALGKLIEECNELSARAARCIVQGIDELDPDTGRTNRAELEREIADVYATIMVVEVGQNLGYLRERIANKISGFERWHALIGGEGDGRVSQ